MPDKTKPTKQTTPKLKNPQNKKPTPPKIPQSPPLKPWTQWEAALWGEECVGHLGAHKRASFSSSGFLIRPSNIIKFFALKGGLGNLKFQFTSIMFW